MSYISSWSVLHCACKGHCRRDVTEIQSAVSSVGSLALQCSVVMINTIWCCVLLVASE